MIELIDDYVIDGNKNEYQLKQRTYRYDKEGNMLYRDTTYHPSVSSALRCLIKRKQVDLVFKNNMTLAEAIERFEAIEKGIKEALRVESE